MVKRSGALTYKNLGEGEKKFPTHLHCERVRKGAVPWGKNKETEKAGNKGTTNEKDWAKKQAEKRGNNASLLSRGR